MIGLLAACLSFGVNAQTPTLKSFHAKAGVQCTTCHNSPLDKKQFTKPENKACLACHGPYEKLAAKTAKMPNDEPNPHASNHYGDGIMCTACHAEHKQSEVYCDNCHQFKYKIK